MTAVISTCGRYRYRLERVMNRDPRVTIAKPRTVLWVMLNPSTADADTDDPTIRKCRGFSTRWGFQRMLVGNLFAYRETMPERLWRAREALEDIIGPETNARLAVMAAEADQVIYAWGNQAEWWPERADEVARTIRRINPEVYILGYTASGQPMHPGRIAYATERCPWMP